MATRLIGMAFFILIFGTPNTWGQSPPVGNAGTQTMNPDISVIADGAVGFWQHRPLALAGDDPDFGSDLATRGGGFTLQEAELGFSSAIDPYLKGDAFLTIPNLGKLEVEEAYVTTTALPNDLQLKVGKFRSMIGRQNGQHLHMQDFTRRPLVNQFFLGVDGLSAPGAQLSWLTPLPFYTSLGLEAFSAGPADDSTTPVQTFGGGDKAELTTVAAAKSFFELSESLSLYLGLDYGQGRSSTVMDKNAGMFPPGNNLRTQIFGINTYFKYKPANVSASYTSIAWQTEYFVRRFSGDDVISTQTDGGAYTQVVYQFARRWYLGGRTDLLGIPTSQFVKPVQRYGVSLTFGQTEFARWRLYGEDEVVASGDYPNNHPPSSLAVMVQYEVSMGAHGAHPF